MKVAAIITGADFKTGKGLVNASLSRVKALETASNLEVDVFAVTAEWRPFTFISLFKGSFEHRTVSYEGRDYTLLVKVEYQSNNRLFRRPLKIFYQKMQYRNQDWGWHKRFAKYFKGYDLLTSHFNDAAFIAEAANRSYSIPFFVTWHGSDIHTIPFRDSVAKEKTIAALEHASCNFFVSNALKQTSDILTDKARKIVAYNGVDSIFYKFDESDREHLRNKYGVNGAKVITFAGNLYPIKNADLLPAIFQKIKDTYSGAIQFWVIGDGELRKSIENSTNKVALPCRYWGNQPHKLMPEFFNCTDVLVLPSKNEGLPLVTLEAISCGANAVGSLVGGIPEAIGLDNCINLQTPDFVDLFAARVIDCLNGEVEHNADSCFSWERSASIEHSEIERILR